jgi:hypothetical protein
MLLVAAVIFRYLAMRAKAAFGVSLTSIFQVVPKGRSAVDLLRQNPDRVEEFRTQALPLTAQQFALDAAACGVFIAAIFLFPPAKFGPTDLGLIQYGSVALVSAALLVDLVGFFRVVAACQDRKSAPAAEEAE